MSDQEMIRFRCPPQCNSYRIVTYFVSGAEAPMGDPKTPAALSHRCLDCGRIATTFLICEAGGHSNGVATLGDTHWEESKERAAAPAS